MSLARTIAVFAIFALLAVGARAQSSRPSQTFDTSAGPVKVKWCDDEQPQLVQRPSADKDRRPNAASGIH